MKDEVVNILKDDINFGEIEQALAGKKALNEVLTTSEAAEIWEKDPSTIKKACLTGRMYPWEARKAQGTWLVTRAGMRRLFGDAE